jgi:hypothetical protein
VDAVTPAHALRARGDLRPLVGVERRRREATPPGTVRIGAGLSRSRAVVVRPRPFGMFLADPTFRAVTAVHFSAFKHPWTVGRRSPRRQSGRVPRSRCRGGS